MCRRVPRVSSSLWLAFCLLSFEGAVIPAVVPPVQTSTADLLTSSDWDTVYDAPGGRRISARLFIRNGAGYYINQFGTRGELRDIRAYDAFPHSQVLGMNPATAAPGPALYGTFELGGTIGFFVFRAPDANGVMDGYSGSVVEQGGRRRLQMGGSWDGRLIGVGESRMPRRIDLAALAFSDWDSTYIAPGGQAIRAQVYLRGSSGHYVPTTGRVQVIGTLSDIEYHERFDHGRIENLDLTRGRWSPAITGTFNLAGTTGFFVFRIPDATGEMDGYWGHWLARDGQVVRSFRGSWDGRLASIGEPAGGAAIQTEVVQPEAIGPAEREVQATIEDVEKVDAAVQAGDGARDELPEGWVRLEGGGGRAGPSIETTFPQNLNLNLSRVGRIVAVKPIRLELENGRVEEVAAGQGFGTGFLVSDSLLLTCGHVLPDTNVAQSSEVHFGRQDFKMVALVERIELVSPRKELDFALVRLGTDREGGRPGANLGKYELIKSDLPNPDGALFGRSLIIGIIHYPLGTPTPNYFPYGMYYKQNRDIEAKDQGAAAGPGRYIGYEAATDKGSSGAPVYDASFRVIALHRGKYGRFEHGVRIDRILDSIRRNGSDSLLKELGLSRQPPK